MHRILLTIMAIWAVSNAAVAQVDYKTFSNPVEGRAIWLDAGSLPKDDTEMAAYVERLARANFNVLIPETVRRGYTIYPSKIDEQDPGFIGFDPLASLIKHAHKNKLEVHAWVTTFRVGYTDHPGPILKTHPDWVAVNKFGDTLSANGGYWLCPSIEAARNYMASLYFEIAKNYDVDGLHFDYIRFESQTPVPYCYNNSCRTQFKAEYGIDPCEIDPFSPRQIEWNAWRERLINTFVQNVSTEARKIKPGIVMSAAVASDPVNARLQFLQNWGNWVDNKWIDFVAPMVYTANNNTFVDLVRKESERVDGKALLLPGLGLLSYTATPEKAAEQIAITRQLDASGSTLFAAVYLKDPFVQTLVCGPFSKPAMIPFRNTDAVVTYLLSEAERLKTTGTPQALGEASVLSRNASTLLRYLQYKKTDVGYVSPTPPPLEIPEVVVPIPTVQVSRAAAAPAIDGNLDDQAWQQASQVSLDYQPDGTVAPVETTVKMAYDDTNVYFAFTATEPKMNLVKATVTKRDGPTFYDDSIELFLDPAGNRRKYYHLSANRLNAQFDASLSNTGWNGNWKVASGKGQNQWTIEVAVPFSDFKLESAPKPGDKWTANLARTRVLNQTEPSFMAWSPTYGTFHRPERFGVIEFK